MSDGPTPEVLPPHPGHEAAASTSDDELAPWVACENVSRVYGPGADSPGVVAATCRLDGPARVALTGSSGSGKSTLLHLMAGLDTPTSGRVRWPRLGDPTGRPDAIGFVFQGPSLLTDLDVAENVTLPLLFATDADSRLDEAASFAAALRALERVGLADLAGKMPDELSGGQAQRVAVARILLSRPRVIFADEPTGQLDENTGQQVVSVLLEAADELDAALVVATHDPRVARRLDEHWSMHDGRLETGHPSAAGPPYETSQVAGEPS